MNETDESVWARLSPLLDELLELEAGPRAARLQQIRAGDLDIAERLDRLLSSGDAARQANFLTGSVAAAVDAVRGSGSLEGLRLGAYVLETPIGQGGAGTVWRARRDDGRFAGSVAIKLLHLSLIAKSGAERFRREGAILARLVHPNIARLMDAGVGPTGQPYLVLELVEGERLDRFCDARKLGIAQRIALFRQVLDAVAHAHRHLVVHRDVKPSNILVTASGDARLMDFGIAKLLEEESGTGEVTAITREAGRSLTPEYAAPEQWQSGTVTTATDIYALGMLLFELLSGVRPRREGALDAPGAAESLPRAIDRLGTEALEQVAAARGVLPSVLRRALTGDLKNIAARALAVDPAARYASADAFAEDLRRHLAHEPVMAQAPSFGYRVRKFSRRHRVPVAAGLLAALAIGAGVVGTATQARRAADQARVARMERDHALRALSQAEAAKEFIGFLLSEGGGKPIAAPQLLERGERLVERQFAQDPELRAQLFATLSNEYASFEETARAETLMARALAAARAARDPHVLGQLLCLDANLKTQAGRYVETQALVASGLTQLGSRPGADGAALAICLSARAHALLETGDASRALADAKQSLAVLGTPRPGLLMQAIQHRNVLADVQARLGDYPGAIASYERAIADFAAMGRGDTSEARVMENNLGVVQMNAGLLARAARTLEHSRATTQGSFGEAGINPITDTNLAGVWVELGRADEATKLLEGALAFAERVHNDRLVGFIAVKTAAAWCAAGDAEQCAARLAQGRAALIKILPPGHSAFGTVAMTKARLSLLRGDDAQASRQLQQAIALYDAATERNPMGFVARGLRARLEQRLGHSAQATELSDRAVRDARTFTGKLPFSEWLGSALLTRATVLSMQGNRDAARATARESLAQLNASIGDVSPASREAVRLLARL